MILNFKFNIQMNLLKIRMLKYYPKERANSQQLYREISLQNFEKIIFNNNSASDV